MSSTGRNYGLLTACYVAPLDKPENAEGNQTIKRSVDC